MGEKSCWKSGQQRSVKVSEIEVRTEIVKNRGKVVWKTILVSFFVFCVYSLNNFAEVRVGKL